MKKRNITYSEWKRIKQASRKQREVYPLVQRYNADLLPGEEPMTASEMIVIMEG